MRRIPWESGFVSVVFLAFALAGGYFLFNKDWADWIFPNTVVGKVWIAMALVALLSAFLGGIGGIYLAAATVRDEEGHLWPRENLLGRSVKPILKPKRGYCKAGLITGFFIVWCAVFACIAATAAYFIIAFMYANLWVFVIVVTILVMLVAIVVGIEKKQISTDNGAVLFALTFMLALAGGFLYYNWPDWYVAITSMAQTAPRLIIQTATSVAFWFMTSEGIPFLITFGVIIATAFVFWLFTKTRFYRTRICPKVQS